MQQLNLRERVDPSRAAFETLLAHLPAGDSRAAFADELRFVCELFCDLTGVSEVGLRLETLDRDMCRFWHTDKVALRLESQDQDSDDSSVLRPYATVNDLDRFAVGVFKGAAWPCPHKAVVHRSPPVAPGERRLLLTLAPLA
jgi:hypothetical protein